MACPDRMKDARIIAEIERRKAMVEGRVEPDHEPIMLHTWAGDLWELQFLGIDQNRITNIEQVSPGVWVVSYLE